MKSKFHLLLFVATMFISNGYAQKIKLNVLVMPDFSIVMLNNYVVDVTPLQENVTLNFDEYLKYKLTIKHNGVLNCSNNNYGFSVTYKF
ncbi:MAG: hypothetical protein ACOYMA_22740 [Bacteroidia bacterium]